MDSVLLKYPVENGGIKGMEYIIQSPASNNLEKGCGWFLHRRHRVPTALCLYSPADAEKIRMPEKFLLHFGCSHAKPLTSLTCKDKIAAPAGSAPPPTIRPHFHACHQRIEHFPFFKSRSSPTVRCLAPYRYNDSVNQFYTAGSQLMHAAAKLQDTSANSFVASHYFLLDGKAEYLKYRLLSLLAAIHSQSSYDLLKQLLLKQPPASGDPDLIKYLLIDSLKLTATLFPGFTIIKQRHSAGEDTSAHADAAYR